MSETNEVLTMPCACPMCGHKVDRASHSSLTETHTPESGDIAICIGCAAINIYADNLGTLRKISAEEMADLEADSSAWFEVRKIQIAIKQLRGKGGIA